MGTSLTGNNISQSYLGLLKSTDSQALGSTAKRLTDGAGNDTPLYLSTSRLGIGVASPSRVLDVSGDIEVHGLRLGKGGGSISTNTVFGQNAINNSSNTGAGNVAIGHSALIVNTSGSFNVGIGLTPLVANTTGQKNIAIGNDSLESNQTGSFNTAIGNETLKELSSGGHNIAIGNEAGNGIQTGSQSIIIGSQADASDVTSQNEIVIGYNLSGNGSNTVTIGNSSITTNYFNGNILLGNSSKLIFGTSDVYISGTTVSDNIQLGVGGSTQFTFAQTTGLRLHQYGSGSITGTVTQRLGVTSTGQVVEIPIGAGALDGSGTAGRVAKFTDSDTLGNSGISDSSNAVAITINGNEEVGIGVSPLSVLHIGKPSGNTNLRIESGTASSITGTSTITMISRNASSGTSPSTKIESLFEDSHDSALAFHTSDAGTQAEKMRITSVGTLLVGTTSAQSGTKFQVDGVSYFQGVNTTNGTAVFVPESNKGTAQSHIHYGTTGDWFIRPASNSGKVVIADNVGMKVGIGTSSPNHLLDVESEGASMRLYNTTSNGNTEFFITTAGTTGASKIMFGDSDDADVGKIIYRHNGNSMAFETNDSEHMRIASDGAILVTSDGSDDDGANLTLKHANNNTTDTIGTIFFGNNADDSLSSISSDTLTNNTTSNLIFKTSDTGTLSEAVRISENGLVGIGTSSIDRPLHVESSSDSPIQVESTDDTTGIMFKDNNSSNALFYRGNGNYFYTSSRFNVGDLGSTKVSTALGVSATSYDAGNSNGNGEDEFLALFQAGTNSVYKQRYIKIAQTFTGGAKKSPIIAFEANHDGDNHKSYGTIGIDTDGSFQFSNIADQSSAIAPGSEIPVTQKMKIESDGRIIINDDANIQGTTFSAGFLRFNSSGKVRLSANNTVSLGFAETLNITNTSLVGIGTTTPNSYNAAGNHLVIAGTGNTGLTIAGGTSNDSNIFFADGTSGADAYRGILRYQHSDNSMLFFTNATERIKITNTGEITLSNSDGIRLSPQVSNLYTVSGSLSFYGTDNAVYLNGAGANGHLRLNAAGGENGRNTIDIFGSSASAPDTINFRTVAGDRARFNSNGVLTVGSTNVQTQARLNVRENGSGIEFGHTNTTDFYFGTLGSLGSNGSPFISWSCMNEHNVNTFTTKGAKGNLIRSNTAGELVFQQVTATNTTGQTPVTRMTLNSSGNFFFENNVSVNQASLDAPLQVRQTRDTNGNIRNNGTYAFIAEGNDTGAVGEGIGIHLSGKKTNGSPVRGVSLLALIQDTGNGHDLVFATSEAGNAPAERGRITDTGDLLIGKSTVGVPSTGVELRKVGTVVATRDAGTPAIFNREGTTKGNIVDIRQDNVAVMTLGTTGDNTFVQGTANSQDLLLRTNSTNRIRIHDYGATSFDTYGAVTTTPTARLHQHQIFTMSCTAAASGTAKAMVNVGNTNAFDYTIVARIDSNDICVIAGRTATANGNNSGFFSRTAFTGDVSAITPSYNAFSDTLDVAVTYSGSATVTVNITINGVSEVELTRTGGCST